MSQCDRHVDDQNDEHDQGEGQMCHVPVFEQLLHGLKSPDAMRKRELLFHRADDRIAFIHGHITGLQ
jgi:hypothetical protein